ncbi:DUF4178 domain-containing protein [Crenobacter cavernae]|uniref:DUF4178 domain-containing protein n=1 Tax=Crenobacter cavernae TaxID=2290923 RepID=A0A345Y942_9NEIS|nr:DUF4178 domain-containing protein [Crenobacter cavernae]AXK40444.1 DUF4178 domain-containing protein [Crenobacter cavernae]
MYTLACPSCGAPVNFRSAASVIAVCEYCQSTLLRDADTVKDIGKMSAVLEDYSPVQIGTSGRFNGDAFTVVGRIQLRYDAGFWNEWYLLFDDGGDGWWSDASGQHVITRPIATPPQAPAFAGIFPGYSHAHEGTVFTACDVRSARCVAGEGELPFRVGEGWVARVADFRADARFLSFDYSDDAVRLYSGCAVELAELSAQLLREPESIAETAGRLPGSPQALDCPSCGSPLAYRAGMATQLVCAACHAEVDCAGDKAVVLQKHSELAQKTFTLAPGDTAKIDGADWTLIGLTQKRERDSDEVTLWVEYLLFNAQRGFLWLIESDTGWERATVLNRWPKLDAKGRVELLGKPYRKLYDYGGEVVYAAGAFNWRVRLSDKVAIADYENGGVKLSSEQDANEISWTQSRKVAAAEVGRWFGKPITAKPSAQSADERTLGGAAKVLSIIYLFINLPMVFDSGFMGFVLIAVTLGLIWAPHWFPDLLDS